MLCPLHIFSRGRFFSRGVSGRSDLSMNTTGSDRSLNLATYGGLVAGVSAHQMGTFEGNTSQNDVK